MSKSILIERRIGSLKYIKEDLSNDPSSTRIGRLEGIAADFKNPTRNGRRYPRELWVNVMNSDDFKEGMETHTILGENDHPETRVDTSIKEVSIVLVEMTIDDEEGVVKCIFDILPTEEGYKLKSLLDYGCQIGVSSRGLGDEVQKDGETIIDPDTYVFYGFDAVIMPAVKSARPTVVESVDRQKMVDRFSKDIENATTIPELESLKKVADVMKLPELDSLVESIDIKLNSLTEGNDISSKLEADLGALAKENEELKSKIATLESQLSASNTRLTETKDVLSKTRNNSGSLMRELSQANEIIVNLKSKLRESEVKNSKLLKRASASKVSLENLKSENAALSSKLEESNEEILSNEDSINSLQGSISSYKQEIRKLESANVAMKEKLEKSSREIKELDKTNKLTESKQNNTSKALKESANKLSTLTKKYIETKCSQEGLSYEHVMSRISNTQSIEEIDKLISEMSDQNRRFAKVPIVLQPITAKLVESNRIPESDRQTIEFLESFNKKEV